MHIWIQVCSTAGSYTVADVAQIGDGITHTVMYTPRRPSQDEVWSFLLKGGTVTQKSKYPAQSEMWTWRRG